MPTVEFQDRGPAPEETGIPPAMLGALLTDRSLEPDRRRGPGWGESCTEPEGQIRTQPILTPQQIAHTQKLIEGQRREDVAGLFRVSSRPEPEGRGRYAGSGAQASV